MYPVNKVYEVSDIVIRDEDGEFSFMEEMGFLQVTAMTKKYITFRDSNDELQKKAYKYEGNKVAVITEW